MISYYSNLYMVRSMIAYYPISITISIIVQGAAHFLNRVTFFASTKSLIPIFQLQMFKIFKLSLSLEISFKDCSCKNFGCSKKFFEFQPYRLRFYVNDDR